MTYSSRQKNESLNYEIEELINMKELISKGDKGTDLSKQKYEILPK